MEATRTSEQGGRTFWSDSRNGDGRHKTTLSGRSVLRPSREQLRDMIAVEFCRCKTCRPPTDTPFGDGVTA